jgi:signal transduction histidine kinase
MGFNLLKSAHRRLQKSIQIRLFVVLFLLGAISLSALVGTSIWLGNHEIQAEVSKRNLEIASLVSSQVDAHFDNILGSLQVEIDNLSGGWRNSIPIMRFVQQAQNNGYEAIAMIDRDGLRFLSWTKSNVNNWNPQLGVSSTPADYSQDPAYLATRQGQIYFSKVTLTPPANEPIITLALPIKTQNGEFNGTVKVDVNLRRSLQIVNSINISPTTDVIVVDETGKVFASSDPELMGQMLSQDKLTLAHAQETGRTTYTDNSGHSFLAGYAPVKNRSGWSVLVVQSVDEAAAGINRLGLVAGALAVVLIIITSVIGVLISRGITRPVRELAIAANRITTTGNLDEQIPITSQDEVGELTASFNGMILALRKTRMALEHWNRELEHKVELRTQEQAQINAQLEQTNLQLERANLHKSQFLANMSHELRTPLNAIIGFSEILQDQVFGSLNDKQARYVNNILSSGRHLLTLVNDVLDLSKVEAGKMELHWEEFSCRSAIYEVQAQLSSLASQKELELNVEVEEELDRIMADRSRFRQILFNLLSNAIKFTPQGGKVTIAGQLENSGKSDCRVLARFSVIDTGIGIAASDLDHIFESFRQVDSSYSRQYQGTGLGLALTKKLVEMHGGTIEVESEPGAGSTFSFTLPLITSLATTTTTTGAGTVVGVGAADAGLPVAELAVKQQL